MPINRRSPYKSSFIVIAILFLFVFVSPAFFQSFRVHIGEAIAVPAGILAGPVLELKKFLLYPKTYDDFQKLKRERDLLKSRLITLEESAKENVRLKALLDLRGSLATPMVAARVIGRDLSNWESSVLVDKGVKDGVKKGAPVVAGDGVVGRVVEATAHSSRVMLLVDPQFSVAGRVRTSQQSVLVSGSLNGTCRVRYTEAQDHINVGDEIVTSSLSSAFPENLMVGTVTSSRVSPDGTPELTVKPAVSTFALEDVLILLSGAP